MDLLSLAALLRDLVVALEPLGNSRRKLRANAQPTGNRRPAAEIRRPPSPLRVARRLDLLDEL
eukprot:10672309-Lingulodinium_polyedra.AAC.1